MRETLCWLRENNVCCCKANRWVWAWLAGWRENNRVWKRLDKVAVQSLRSKIQFQNFWKEKKKRTKTHINFWGSPPQNDGWVGDGSTTNWQRTEPMWVRRADHREIGRMWRTTPSKGKLAEGRSKEKIHPKHKEAGSQHPQQQLKRHISLEQCQDASSELPQRDISIIFSVPADSFCHRLSWQ